MNSLLFKKKMNMSLDDIIKHKLKYDEQYKKQYENEQREERQEREEIERLDKELLDYKNNKNKKNRCTQKKIFILIKKIFSRKNKNKKINYNK